MGMGLEGVGGRIEGWLGTYVCRWIYSDERSPEGAWRELWIIRYRSIFPPTPLPQHCTVYGNAFYIYI